MILKVLSFTILNIPSKLKLHSQAYLMHYKKCHNTTEYYGESFKKWLSQKIPIALINKCTEADQYNYCVTWSITSIPILKNQSKCIIPPLRCTIVSTF